VKREKRQSFSSNRLLQHYLASMGN